VFPLYLQNAIFICIGTPTVSSFFMTATIQYAILSTRIEQFTQIIERVKIIVIQIIKKR
jgi:hypothetical protein